MRSAIVLVAIGIAMWWYAYNTLTGDGSTDATAGNRATGTAAAAQPQGTGTATATATAQAGTYVVAAGDSMAQIATRHNVTLAQLLAANPGLTDPTRIEIGQRLNIPR